MEDSSPGHSFTIEEIYNTTSLKPKRCCGVDKFPIKVVEYVVQEITTPLSTIFNRPIECGTFETVQSGTYTQRGREDNIDNYRPI